MNERDSVFVYGVGPDDADLMVIGEAWGEKEERAGTPFCGVSGDELTRYLSSIRIPRESVYVTNVVNERPPGNSDPTPDMIERHTDRLWGELFSVRPKYVLAVGRFALRWFLGSDASIEREWGLARTINLCLICRRKWNGFSETTSRSGETDATRSEGGEVLDLDGRKGRVRTRSHTRDEGRQVEGRAGSQSSLRIAGRPDTGGAGPGPSLQQPELREPGTHEALHAVRKHATCVQAQVHVQTGTSEDPGEHLFQEESHTWTCHSSRRVQAMQAASQAAVVGQAQGATQCRAAPPRCCTPESPESTLQIIVVGSLHPAYGLYMPEDQILIQEALEGRIGPTWGLAKVMRGEIPPHPPVDQYPNPTYIELLSHDYPQGMPDLSGVEVVAIDTEGSAAHPWCLSFSVRPGEAYVIRPSQRVVMEAFAAWIESAKPTVVCHYLAHDLEVLAALGIHLDPSRCGDTMLIAYELGRMFSQSLKLGAYRELGMLMQDYNDLTRDADRDLAVEYLERVLREGRCDECRGRGIVVTSRRLKNGKLRRSAKKCDACDGDGTSWPVPQPLQVWQNGRLTTWQPSPVGKRVRRILDDVRAGKMNKDDEPTNPRDRWEGADPPEAIAAVTSALGPMPSATLDMVPREEAIAYAARDADATLRRWLLLDPLIDTWGLRDTYNTDLAIIPLVVEMQQTGMEVDTEYFAQLSREWRAEMSRIRHQLQKLVGYYVNPSSGKQVANLLFERLKLPPVKLTKSKASESTDDKVLEQLALRTKHPAVPLIQRHRKLHKLNGTYAHPLSLVDSADGRVRWEIKYTRTDTGRLSSSKPRKGRDKHNWIQGQNIPTRDEDDRKIKHGFVARKGCLLAEFDLSQIEWRITAHLSQDANLLTVFREGHDLHRMTAAKMNHIALDEVTSDQRYAAKRVGFGMGYQATWRAIQEQFALEGIYLTREEAQAFIDGFMAAYPGIPRFWEKVFAEARRNGYVRSTDGRIRWATAIRCTASWVREAAQREIGNMPVQSWAANIMKLVLLAAYKRVIVPMRRAGFDVRMLLTVHDSVLLEFPEGAEAMIDPLMKRVMRETVALSVPVSGDGRWGARWSDCKD